MIEKALFQILMEVFSDEKNIDYSSEFKNIIITFYQMFDKTNPYNYSGDFCMKIIDKIGLKGTLDLGYLQNNDFFFKFYHSISSNQYNFYQFVDLIYTRNL